MTKQQLDEIKEKYKKWAEEHYLDRDDSWVHEVPGLLEHIESLQGQLTEARSALEFYGDQNKWFMKSRITDPSKEIIFASRYNEEKGESEPVDLKEPFEGKSFECTARLKVDQGRTARAYLEKYPEGK